jgi:hypothetical protein
MSLSQTRRADRSEDARRIEVSEMTADGVAAYVDTHGEHAYIERRGGKTFVVTTE